MNWVPCYINILVLKILQVKLLHKLFRFLFKFNILHFADWDIWCKVYLLFPQSCNFSIRTILKYFKFAVCNNCKLQWYYYLNLCQLKLITQNIIIKFYIYMLFISVFTVIPMAYLEYSVITWYIDNNISSSPFCTWIWETGHFEEMIYITAIN